jgi:uncharacterized protein (DUF952 family)
MTKNDSIFHLCVKSNWLAAVSAGKYTMSTQDKTLADVGFIHCSTAQQLQGTAKKFYGDCKEEMVLLEISTSELASAGIEVKYEDAGNGELFPHIYGALPCNLVQSVRPAVFGSSGILEF